MRFRRDVFKKTPEFSRDQTFPENFYKNWKKMRKVLNIKSDLVCRFEKFLALLTDITQK